ncbi:uncharacterized protein LOC114911893 [Scleropages formosus]|uniref:uncharacterized protein LOC114911893 n=1 Tax=Scleropages formosus TaxID=113540 RepID=UPI0010FA979A|nr:uncharacterized protein LOC114911893 [Scleropages formosus]
MDMSLPLPSSCAREQWNYLSSESELDSISSPETISPSSCMDFNFSSSCHPAISVTTSCSTHSETAETPGASSQHNQGAAPPAGKVTKPRLKNPSKRRQSASEKEKLRMRDLTKALHHLRTYLPPSVAPVGQTLTKIETLRLTIRYISHLSEQLGLSEEILSQRTKSAQSQGCCPHSSAPGYQGGVQEWRPHAQQQPDPFTPRCSPQLPKLDHCMYATVLRSPVQNDLFSTGSDSILQLPCSTVPSQPSQVYSKGFHCDTVAHDFWILEQALQ